MKPINKKQVNSKPKIDYKQFLQPATKEHFISSQRDLYSYASCFVLNLRIYTERVLVAQQFDNYERYYPQKEDLIMWVYNIRTKSYSQIKLQWTGTVRINYKTILMQNDVYIVGGASINEGLAEDDLPKCNLMEKYNLLTNKAVSLADLLTGKLEYGYCNDMHQFIYTVCGSYNRIKLNSCEKYDAKTNKWSKLPNTNEAKVGAGCVLVANSLYLFGGQIIKGFTSMIEKLSLTNAKWEVIKIRGSQLSGIFNCFPVYIGKNRVLVFGEQDKTQKVFFELNLAEQSITNFKNNIEENIETCISYNNCALYNNKKFIYIITNTGKLADKIDLQEINRVWVHKEVSLVIPKNDDYY